MRNQGLELATLSGGQGASACHQDANAMPDVLLYLPSGQVILRHGAVWLGVERDSQ